MTSKQDYEAIAMIIAKAAWLEETIPRDGLRLWIACALGEYFKRDNHAFDKSRFLKACNKGAK